MCLRHWFAEKGIPSLALAMKISEVHVGYLLFLRRVMTEITLKQLRFSKYLEPL